MSTQVLRVFQEHIETQNVNGLVDMMSRETLRPLRARSDSDGLNRESGFAEFAIRQLSGETPFLLVHARDDKDRLTIEFRGRTLCGELLAVRPGGETQLELSRAAQEWLALLDWADSVTNRAFKPVLGNSDHALTIPGIELDAPAAEDLVRWIAKGVPGLTTPLEDER